MCRQTTARVLEDGTDFCTESPPQQNPPENSQSRPSEHRDTGVMAVTSLGTHRLKQKWKLAEFGDTSTPLAAESPRTPLSVFCSSHSVPSQAEACCLSGHLQLTREPPYLGSPSPSVPTKGLEEGKCLATGNLIPERSPHRNQSSQCPWPRLAEEPGGREQRPGTPSVVEWGGSHPYYSRGVCSRDSRGGGR